MVIAIRMSSFECSNSSHFRVLMQSNSQTRNRPSHSARRRGRTPRAVGAASRVRLLRASARASFAQCCRCRFARVVAKIPAALLGGSHFACSPIYRSPPHSIAHSARKGVPPRARLVVFDSHLRWGCLKCFRKGGNSSRPHPTAIRCFETLVCIIEEVFDLASPIGRRTKLRERFYRSVVPK